MTIGYLKRKAIEYNNLLRSKEDKKLFLSLCDLQINIVNNFIQYLEESK